MTPKLALKKLTASDLTLFEWHFRHRNAGNQKSINLNADVFVDQLYPAIEGAVGAVEAKLPLDLWVLGPGDASPMNLQRKIIKGAAYKNWRLNGEFISNPIDQPDRFNSLAPDDYVVLAFEGEVIPTAATAIFVARALPHDQQLHTVLDAFGLGGRRTMMALDEATVADVVARAGLAEAHPLASFTLSEELQEAALGSAQAAERLLRSGRSPRLSAEALRKAREAAEDNGRLGEQLVALHLQREKDANAIMDFEWVSKINAVAPLDFRRVLLMAQPERIDVKTTSGPFDREFHVSLSELKEMAAGGGPYRIYRVYEAGDTGAKLRISDDMRKTADAILKFLDGLPKGVTVDAVSINPICVTFGAALDLAPPDEDEGF